MAKNKLEETMKACNALREEEFNVTQGDQIEITDVPVQGEVIEPITDPELEFGEEGNEAKSYLGKNVIFCNICLRPFFSSEELTEQTVCPNCFAESEELELVGKVISPEAEEPAEDKLEAEPVKEPEVSAEEPKVKDNADLDESLEEPKSEVAESNETIVNVSTDKGEVTVKVKEPEDNKEAEKPEEVVNSKSDIEYEYEEESFNKLFTKFLTDNYKNVKSFNLTEAKLSDKLVLEGVITFNNNNTRSIQIVSDAFKLDESVSRVKASCSAFGRSKSFIIEHVIKENKVSATKMNYRFRTKMNNESYEVVGKATI